MTHNTANIKQTISLGRIEIVSISTTDRSQPERQRILLQQNLFCRNRRFLSRNFPNKILREMGDSSDIREPGFKPGLHIIGRIASTCLRPCPKEYITEVTKSQRNRGQQRRLHIFLKNFTFEAWKSHVK